MENISLAGSKNIRDLGGLPVAGGQVRRRCFLRGGSLQNLTATDLDLLVNEYQIATVIDLRTPLEREEMPDAVIPGARYILLPIFDDAMIGITHEGKTKRRRPLEERTPDLAALYRSTLDDCTVSLAAVVRCILELTEPELPVLFHCTEGKDRTGIVAMLLLSLLGATRATIREDYLFTNTVNQEKAAAYYDKIMRLKQDPVIAAGIRDAFLAKEEYLAAAFGLIDSRWGGTDSFLENALGISRTEQQSFCRKYVVTELSREQAQAEQQPDVGR